MESSEISENLFVVAAVIIRLRPLVEKSLAEEVLKFHSTTSLIAVDYRTLQSINGCENILNDQFKNFVKHFEMVFAIN